LKGGYPKNKRDEFEKKYERVVMELEDELNHLGFKVNLQLGPEREEWVFYQVDLPDS